MERVTGCRGRGLVQDSLISVSYTHLPHKVRGQIHRLCHQRAGRFGGRSGFSRLCGVQPLIHPVSYTHLNQQREFEDIPAPILFTTNCIMPLRESYADREMCIRDREWS